MGRTWQRCGPRISMEYDDRKLFVAKMPEDIREEEIKIVFNTYGTVQEVVMLGAERSRPGQRCGFVIYETSQAARSAVQVLDNVYKFRESCPEPIHVSVARPRGGKGKDGKDQGHGFKGTYGKGYDQGYNSVHSDPYGGYAGATSDPYGGYDSGFGKGCGKGGCKGYDGWSSWGGDGYGNGGKGGFGGGGGGKGEPGTKLYVGNLPGDIPREDIERVFKTYGSVTDVHLMTGKSKSGQACAFVRYSTQVEANNAIAAMAQGYEIRPGEGNIIVKLADGPDGKGSKGRPGPY